MKNLQEAVPWVPWLTKVPQQWTWVYMYVYISDDFTQVWVIWPISPGLDISFPVLFFLFNILLFSLPFHSFSCALSSSISPKPCLPPPFLSFFVLSFTDKQSCSGGKATGQETIVAQRGKLLYLRQETLVNITAFMSFFRGQRVCIVVLLWPLTVFS